MTSILYKQESYEIMGACFEVYRNKGCGFLEGVYQECLQIELGLRGIPFDAQPTLCLDYKGTRLCQTYVPDFICYGKIILELKAVSELTDQHRAQLLNYLRATDHRLGLLIDFAHYPKIQWERLVFEKRAVPRIDS
jgi:GxxExxY protein